mgnify:CR=1 FL=1
MNIKFTLFVHGVPKGQKIWGPSEQDRDYIGLYEIYCPSQSYPFCIACGFICCMRKDIRRVNGNFPGFNGCFIG